MPVEPKKKMEFETKKRANTGCLRGLLYLLFIVGSSFFIAVFAWNCANDVLALNKTNRPDDEVTITILENYSLNDLSRTLAKEGVIDRPWLFTLFCRFSKAEEKIEAGVFTISTRLDYNAIVKSFVNIPVREEVWVVIPEGKNILEIFEMLSENGVCSVKDLARAAEEEEFSHSFLQDLPMSPNWLEGYLYPDTYIFYTDSNPRSVLSKMLSQFGTMLTPSVRDELAAWEAKGYDLNDILTIASLIQLEAATISEMRNISSVIHNRLGNRNFPHLQIDATAVYLMKMEGRAVTSAEDVLEGRKIDSPYNTSMYEGLPPGPICSPGLEAIRAAIYPAKTSYYYYALSTDRTHEFFSTEAAFNNFRRSSNFSSW
jgi:UPF0755 protein